MGFSIRVTLNSLLALGAALLRRSAPKHSPATHHHKLLREEGAAYNLLWQGSMYCAPLHNPPPNRVSERRGADFHFLYNQHI